MDIDFYISTYKEISKAIWILLFSTLILEGYLVQRCFQWNSNLDEKIVNLDPNPEDYLTLENIIWKDLVSTQTEHIGLKINYGTLTLLWPLVIWFLFLLSHFLLKMRYEVLKELKSGYPDFKLSSLRLYLYSLLFSNKSEQNIIFILLFIMMPIVGLSFHGYSGFYMIQLISEAIRILEMGIADDIQGSQEVVNQLVILFYSQILISIILLIIILFINIKSVYVIKNSANIILNTAGSSE